MIQGFLAGQAGGEVYYRPLPFENEPNHLTFADIARKGRSMVGMMSMTSTRVSATSSGCS